MEYNNDLVAYNTGNGDIKVKWVNPGQENIWVKAIN